MESITVSIDDLINLVRDILVAHNTSDSTAIEVATALVAAEIDGQKGHGLSRVPSYSAQAKTGKVNGQIKPIVKKVSPSLLRSETSTS